MKKFKLTNPIEYPVPQEKQLMYLSNILSKRRWLFLVLWTLFIGVMLFFIGRWVGRQQDVEDLPNPYLGKDFSNQMGGGVRGAGVDDETGNQGFPSDD